jgi:hypothetical protein
MKPIFDVMKEKGVIEKRMFSICLGKDGGYFQLGGYDGRSHLSEVQWAPLLNYGNYKVNVVGISMNNHYMAGSE